MSPATPRPSLGRRSFGISKTTLGLMGCFDFTDNRASGSPDTIDGEPIQAGNIVIG